MDRDLHGLRLRTRRCPRHEAASFQVALGHLWGSAQRIYGHGVHWKLGPAGSMPPVMAVDPDFQGIF